MGHSEPVVSPSTRGDLWKFSQSAARDRYDLYRSEHNYEGDFEKEPQESDEK